MESWGTSGAATPAVRQRRVRVGAPPSAWIETEWREGGHLALAEPSAPLKAFVAAALRAEGLQPDGEAVLVRHRPGDRGLPPLIPDAGFSFAIDLTEARRVLDGGLLLFVDGGGRVIGWRAEAGAMTLWSGDDPELTELAPGSPERLTLVGRARTI